MIIILAEALLLATMVYLFYTAYVDEGFFALVAVFLVFLSPLGLTAVIIQIEKQKKYDEYYSVYCESSTGRVLYDGEGVNVRTEYKSSAVTGYTPKTGKKFTITGQCVVEYIEKRKN